MEKVCKELDLHRITYNPIDITHSFTAFKVGDFIILMLHTSKNFYSLINDDIDNIKIDDPRSPLKFINPPCVMKINYFERNFKITNWDDVKIPKRYGDVSIEDLEYYSISAGVTSIKQSKIAVNFEEIYKDINLIKIEKIMQINEKNEVKPPLFVILNKNEQQSITEIISETQEYVEVIKKEKEEVYEKYNLNEGEHDMN